MNLPIVTEPLPEETFQSWAHRLSAPYLVGPDTFLTNSQKPSINPRTCKNSELLLFFAQLTGLKKQRLYTIFAEDIFSQEYLGVSSSVKNIWATKLPIKHCEQCWAEDEGRGLPKYMRRAWLEPWRIACSHHSNYLKDHQFEKRRGGSLYSYKTNAFFLKRGPSEFLDDKSLTGIPQKFHEAYQDLYLYDPTRSQLTVSYMEDAKLNYNKYHLNIEGFVQALEVLQINQYPVFRNNFMNWLAEEKGYPTEIKFPQFETGSPRALISDMSNECKVAAIELVYPWFVKGKITRSNAAKSLVSPASPLRSSIGKHVNDIQLTDPFSLILSCIRKDMREDAISFLSSRNNILVPILEKHHDRLLEKMVT